jgi:hypothetical protein
MPRPDAYQNLTFDGNSISDVSFDTFGLRAGSLQLVSGSGAI